MVTNAVNPTRSLGHWSGSLKEADGRKQMVPSNGKIDQSISGLVVVVQGWLRENQQGTGHTLGQPWRVFTIPDLNKKGRGCSGPSSSCQCAWGPGREPRLSGPEQLGSELGVSLALFSFCAPISCQRLPRDGP